MSELFCLVFVLSVAASFVQRVSGFGFGIFIMMFLPYVMPSYNEAVALSGLLSGTTALAIVLFNFKHICWAKIPIIFLFNALVSYFVIKHMVTLSEGFMMRCLGFALILIALYFLLAGDRKIKGVVSRWAQAVVGVVSGIMGSMFGMPGPPVVLYGVNAIGDKKAYMATMQSFWLLFNCFYFFCRSGGGYYTADTPLYLIVGVAGVVVGIFLGARCFSLLSGKAFKVVVYSVMLLSGVVALLK